MDALLAARPVDLDRVREDFDRIAERGGAGVADHSSHLLRQLLARIPARSEAALDLGCGAGSLARVLAGRAQRVVGVDVSPGMLALARAATEDLPNVRLVQADFMTHAFPVAGFDLVCAVATLHHLEFEPALARAAALVRPGGHLLVLDLYQAIGVRGFVERATSWLYAQWLDRGRPRPTPAARAAWREHGDHDRYPTLTEVRHAARGLAGAEIAMRLPWRWSLLWRRPS